MNYEGLTGKVVVPGDPGYERARQEYNIAIQKYPAVIVYCFEADDIKNAIVWSREQGIELRVRSGGHDYEGYSTGNGKLVIDTSPLNGVRINEWEDTVTVQAGTRLLTLYEELYQSGYAFPGGTCPTVGISGLVLGGGIGLSTRYLGLTADSLLQARMIDYEGRQLTADCACNAELFWALRGAGGGNFGVVTDYKFRVPRVNNITVIQLRWDDNLAARYRFLETWQDWLPQLDRRLSLFGGIYKFGAWVNAFFYGTSEEARQVLQPLLNIPGLTLETIRYVPFIDAIKLIGAIYPPREAFQAAGRFVHRHFLQQELAGLIDVIDKAPSSPDSSIRVYSLGGAVRDTAAAATAFPYRQADYIIAVASSWEQNSEADSHREWILYGFEYLYPITRGSYINFPYSLIPDYQQAYFDGNLCRLQAVKKTYDPCDIFRFPQSIRLP